MDEMPEFRQPLPGGLIDAMMLQLVSRLDSAEKRVADLAHEVGYFRQAMNRLAEQQGDLDERLRTLQRLLSDQRVDVTTENALVHLGLAHEYTVLATQRFLHVARQLARADQAGSGLETAHLVADLCHLLFGPEAPRPKHVLRPLGLGSRHPAAPDVTAITEAAIKLRRSAEATRDQIRWDFEAETGVQLSDRQQPWANCDPDHPVRFVVVPAYLANATMYVHQLVYTSAQPLNFRPPAAPPAAD
jgi:hypothetical protein